MQIQFQNKPALMGADGWLQGDLQAVDNGDSVIVLPNGRVFSLQPNADYSDRDPGTKGVWERCRPDPSINVLRFNPGLPYAIVYRLV
jgi:hypothetical protein